MRLLKDEEVKRLATEEVLDKVLKHYEETDVWHFCRANEVHVKGINNLPLFYMSYAGKITATCPGDVFEENIKESGLFIEIPDAFDEKLTYAIREIGLESAYDRAGLSCRLMRTIEDTALVRALDAEQRGILLDTGFAQSSEEIKIWSVTRKFQPSALPNMLSWIIGLASIMQRNPSCCSQILMGSPSAMDRFPIKDWW